MTAPTPVPMPEPVRPTSTLPPVPMPAPVPPSAPTAYYQDPDSAAFEVEPRAIAEHAGFIAHLSQQMTVNAEAGRYVAGLDDAFGVLCRPFAWALNWADTSATQALGRGVTELATIADRLHRTAERYARTDLRMHAGFDGMARTFDTTPQRSGLFGLDARAPTENPRIADGTDVRSQYSLGAAITTIPVRGDGWWQGVAAHEQARNLRQAIDRGDWVAREIAGFGVSLEVLAATVDPASYVVGQAGSWLLEHVERSRVLLHVLTGNPTMIRHYGQTWQNIGDSCNGLADQYESNGGPHVAGWSGRAAREYRAEGDGSIDQLRATAELAHGVALMTIQFGQLVAGVRALVRDNLATAAAEAITLPLSPSPVASIARRVANTTDVARAIQGLFTTMDQATWLLQNLRTIAETLWAVAGPGPHRVGEDP